MNETLEKAKVVAKNVLTYLILIQTVLTWMLANNVLGEWPQAVEIAFIVVTWIGAAVAFIRRVTPVDKSERGLLPQ